MHKMQEYLQTQCPALAKHTELNPRECDELLDKSKEDPQKLFNILWMLNALCLIKQAPSKFSKNDFIALLGY